MYKYIFSIITIAVFIGCSAPKPEILPMWYTSLPQDSQFFYATGSGKNKTKAKNNAIINLRSKINYDLDKAFLDKTIKIKIAKNKDVKAVFRVNEIFSNSLSLLIKDLKIEETTRVNRKHLVLVKLPRNLIFDYKNKISSKKIKNKFNELKQNISFYILSDINSKIFVSGVKNAIIASGLTISSQPIGNDILKLFITSKTVDSQDYSFNKSHTLIKYRTYNQNKEIIAFRQHTFISKSRISYLDAKQQSVIYEKSKIKKLGIYNFIGLN